MNAPCESKVIRTHWAAFTKNSALPQNLWGDSDSFSVTFHDQPELIQSPVSPVVPALTTEREGYTNYAKSTDDKKSFCLRLGCFVSCEIDPRTPHKKYCSHLCDNALRAAVTQVERYYRSRDCIGAITSRNRMKVLLVKPGSCVQLRVFQSVVLRC